jgi:alpha-galactosidase
MVERTPEESEKMRRVKDDELKQLIGSEAELPVVRKNDYGVSIINAIETGMPARVTGNVKNTNLITNLLKGCCVEVPCLVDKEGVHPCYIGDLPAQCAALNRTNVNVQELAVRGIVEKDKTKIFQALLLDPLTSAILTIDETREMVGELFEVDKKFLKGYK